MKQVAAVVELEPGQFLERTIVVVQSPSISSSDYSEILRIDVLQDHVDEKGQHGYIDAFRLDRHDDPSNNRFIFQHVKVFTDHSAECGKSFEWNWDNACEEWRI